MDSRELKMDSKRLHKKLKDMKFHSDINKIDITLMNHYMKLYFDMKRDYMELLDEVRWDDFEIKSKRINREEMINIIESSSFMSKEIGNEIKREFHYEWRIKYREVELIYFSKNEKLGRSEKESIKEMILVTILFKKLYKRDENYNQKITYFPTLLKKKIDFSSKKSLGKNECNSGLTYINQMGNYFNLHNGDIIIFRKEENIKVLIHEMFHSNYRDLMLIRHMNNSEFTDNFCTDYDILLNESYTEFNATIMNIFYIGVKNDMKIKEIKELLQEEIKYGIYVCKKILQFYGLDSVKDIMRIKRILKRGKKEIIQCGNSNGCCNGKLSQKTNVIAYYLFKPIQMFHLSDMNRFIGNHTEELGIKNYEAVQKYKNNILKWIQNDDWNELLNIKNHDSINDKEDSLRMTMFEA